MIVTVDDAVPEQTGEASAFSAFAFATARFADEKNRSGVRSNVTVLNMTRSTVLATRAQLALSAAARACGLLGRESLEEGEGLVIRPCKGVHGFGMRFAIDVAYANRAGVVVCLLAPLLPGKAGPVMREASWVVELPEGVLARTGTVIGDRLQVFYPK